MTVLLDSSVLIALNVGDHSMNEAATQWFESRSDPFSTCPITRGALLRHEWDAGAARTVVTDAYLAQLARFHAGTVATFDRGFALLRPDVAELVPTS